MLPSARPVTPGIAVSSLHRLVVPLAAARVRISCGPALVDPAADDVYGQVQERAPDDVPRKLAVQSLSESRSGLQLVCRPFSWNLWGQVRRGDRPACVQGTHVGIAALHLVVRTVDDLVLTTRRSQATSFHPGCWSVSLEEQLDVSDTDLHTAVRRAVAEELGIDDATDALLHALAREHDPSSGAAWGVAAFASCRVPMTGPQLIAAHDDDPDAFEHAALQVLPVEQLLAWRDEPPAQGLHPTAALRLALLATS